MAKKEKEVIDTSIGKEKALELALSQIEKQFGKGAVMKLGEFKTTDVEAINKLRCSIRNWWYTKRKNNRNIWSRIIW